MPLRLDSITNNSQDSSLIAWILQSGTQECDSAFATPDKKYIHMKRKIVDRSSGDKIGELIFTLQNTGKQLEVLDIDIILANETASRIRFETLKEQSDSNEYYEVSTIDQDAHLIIETVNRFTEPDKLIDTERDVHISIFPFQVNLFENMDGFNRWAGFSEPIEAGEGTGLFVHGFSERFCMPGGLMSDKENDNDYSFIIGKVESFRDVSPNCGDHKIPFVLAMVDTALGVVPVAMGRDVFDLTELKVGCVVAMNAVVKADVAAPGVYSR